MLNSKDKYKERRRQRAEEHAARNAYAVAAEAEALGLDADARRARLRADRDARREAHAARNADVADVERKMRKDRYATKILEGPPENKGVALRDKRAGGDDDDDAEGVDPFAGIAFASSEAEQAAREAGVAYATQLRLVAPSGKTGLTVADVRDALGLGSED